MGRFYKAGVPCHLCGFPIADWVVYQHHPLSGTIDHIIPRSMGGTDRASNRAPAHACCNWERGTQEITDQVRQKCMTRALAEFRASLKNIPQTKKWKRVRRMVSGKPKSDSADATRE